MTPAEEQDLLATLSEVVHLIEELAIRVVTAETRVSLLEEEVEHIRAL